MIPDAWPPTLGRPLTPWDATLIGLGRFVSRTIIISATYAYRLGRFCFCVGTLCFPSASA